MTEYPDKIHNEDQLEELLSRPKPELVEMFLRVEGDIMFLGISGKIGPSLAKMARRTCEKTGVKKRILGVALQIDPEQQKCFSEIGIETIQGDLLDKDFIESLPAFGMVHNVIDIKIAPFNRYQTLDVVRGVVESGRADDIALYTGNDDNILVDLLTEYKIPVGAKIKSKRIVGGLLGHWAVWTHSAVGLLNAVHNGEFDTDVQRSMILANQITDCNAAFFDTANNYKGCIVGMHEVLRRQGLFQRLWTLDRQERLSPGQKKEIDRVYIAYPELNDDAFIAENLERWLS